MAHNQMAQFVPAEIHGRHPEHERFIAEVMARYKALFDSNMFGLAATDFQDTIISANDAFLSMIGYSKKDIDDGTLKWSTISPSKYDGADIEKMSELLMNRTIVPFEKEYIHKDGHTVPVLVGAEAFDEAISFGVCFALDISELKALEQKKDDFVGMVAHELKTPLSIMKLYADFLRSAIRDGASKEELMESANEISSQVDKLSVLITDLLNMAKYKAQEDTFPVSAFDVHECVKKIITELSLVHDRNIIFQGEKAVYISGNLERLSQVVINLLNNAIRYSEDGTDIIVHVHHDHDHAFIEMQDFGMGIAPDDQKRIFERYYRVNHADAYADKGAGIGLFICNEIVKYHKGEILVKSEMGKGSTFIVKIPLIKTENK